MNFEDATTESFPIATVRSISFDSGDMQLNLLAGTTLAWPIVDIWSYAFSPLTTSVGDGAVAGMLEIFPNPASEQVIIRFGGLPGVHYTVDIFDASGRLVARLFDGEATAGTTQVMLDPRAQGMATSGLYVCRVTSADGVRTSPIMIQ